MFGTRRFMDEAPVLGLPVFQSLSGEARLAQGATVTPTPSPVVEKTSTRAKVLTGVVTLGVGLFALELVGVTNVTGVRKFLSR